VAKDLIVNDEAGLPRSRARRLFDEMDSPGVLKAARATEKTHAE